MTGTVGHGASSTSGLVSPGGEAGRNDLRAAEAGKAAEVIRDMTVRWFGPNCKLVAAGIGHFIIDGLADAGYAVVQLPEPDSTRYEGDEHEPIDRLAWCTGSRFAVSHWEYPEVQVAYDDEPLEPIGIDEARRFAAALLAASVAASSAVTGEDQ